MAQVIDDTHAVRWGSGQMQPTRLSDTAHVTTHAETQVARADPPTEPSPHRVNDSDSKRVGDPRVADRVDQQAWGMTQGDRRFVLVMTTVLFLFMFVNWVRIVAWRPSNFTVERPTAEEYRFLIDVNTATWVEWMQLDGIGETLARRIVSYREEQGPFQSVDDIDRIPGVGPKTFAKIRDKLVCQPSPAGQ